MWTPSYLAPYYLPEANSEVVERSLLKLPVGSLVISPLVRAEFASLLSRKCRAKEMGQADARRTMTAFDRHLGSGSFRMISILSSDFQQATEWIMAMQHALRAPMAINSQPQHANFPLTLKVKYKGLPKRSWIKISQIRTLSIERIGKKLGRILPEELSRVIEGFNEIIGA